MFPAVQYVKRKEVDFDTMTLASKIRKFLAHLISLYACKVSYVLYTSIYKKHLKMFCEYLIN